MWVKEDSCSGNESAAIARVRNYVQLLKGRPDVYLYSLGINCIDSIACFFFFFFKKMFTTANNSHIRVRFKEGIMKDLSWVCFGSPMLPHKSDLGKLLFTSEVGSSTQYLLLQKLLFLNKIAN